MRIRKLFILVLFGLAASLTGCVETGANVDSTNDKTAKIVKTADVETPPISRADAPADRLEVFYFHKTARCHSCTTVENYVSDVVKERFAEEVKSGLIDFRTINVDLPENEALARKFKATGSSLYLNRITGGQDNIEFYSDVWRLFGNEESLKNQLEIKIKSLLVF
ncbi:MAG: nitrophenyl compound nitroreductase subunit ArsF family protein [Candidatus Falkowbacteria bacterium]